MRKTALLHIGTHKTGTTSIQRYLTEAQVNGSLAPFCYPLWKQSFHHNDLIMLYYPHEQLAGTMRQMYPSNDRRFRRARQDLRQFFFDELHSADGAIISGEPLCGFAISGVAQLRADLESVGFRKFHVVIYIRDPADYYLSRTQQALKETGADPSWLLSRTHHGGDAVTESDQDPVMDPTTFIYDFRRAVQTWEHVFPGSLIVRPFPRTPNFDVIDDFAGVLEEQLGLSLKRTPMRMNTTLSAEAMQVLQDYRRAFWPNSRIVTPDALRLVEFLKHSADAVPQTKPGLKAEIAEQIRANHSLDAEAVRTRYGVDLGIRNLTPRDAAPHCRAYRVDEILESVNPTVVNELLLRVAKSEFSRVAPKTPLALRAARRAYRTLPPPWRPQRLVHWSRNVRQRVRS